MGDMDNVIYVDGGRMLVRQAKIDAASAGDNTVVSAVSGYKIRVVGIKFSVAGDVTTKWMSDTGGSAVELVHAETWKAGGGMSDYWGPHGYFFETASGKALNLYLGGAVQVSGWLNYILVAG